MNSITRRFLYPRQAKVWEDTDYSEFNYIGVEKLRRIYLLDSEGQKSVWDAVLIAHQFEDIQRLLNLEPHTNLEVRYVLQGRLDLRSKGIRLIELKDCIPQVGWFDNLSNSIFFRKGDDEPVPYRLQVTCKAEINLDEILYLEESSNP